MKITTQELIPQRGQNPFKKHYYASGTISWGDGDIEFEGRGSTPSQADLAVIDNMIKLRDTLTETIDECIREGL